MTAKTAPCVVCGKMLPLPPWPIVEGSLKCLEHMGPKPEPLPCIWGRCNGTRATKTSPCNRCGTRAP